MQLSEKRFRIHRRMWPRSLVGGQVGKGYFRKGPCQGEGKGFVVGGVAVVKLIFPQIWNGTAWLLLGCLVLCGVSSVEGQARRQLTLEAAVQEAFAAFAAGDFAGAASRFEQIERDFGREAEFRSETLQRSILPMRGYAELMRGRASAAIPFFERYLETAAGDDRRRSFVEFALAQAYQAAGRPEDAIAAYIRYIQRHPRAPEAGIATLRVAELRVLIGAIDAAIEGLNQFYRSPGPFTMRQQARLRALQLALDNDLMKVGADILLQTQWAMEGMPELALLSFSALRLGDHFLQNEEPGRALQAYRLVSPLDILRERQAARLRDLRASVEARRARADAARDGAWIEHFSGVVARLESLMTQLEEMEDYTPGFLMRYGMAFFGDGRLREARIVFQRLAESARWPEELRREAHYRWILTLQEEADWAGALAVADVFLRRYPGAPELPLTLFLIANAYQQQGDSNAAVDVLTRLVDEFADHRLHSRWIFARGFNQLFTEAYAGARADFATFQRVSQERSLVDNAALWHALAWFFERQNERALEELQALERRFPQDHYLYPEVAYRLGAVLYAMRRYEDALAQIRLYTEQFPQDGNFFEALVLEGDTLMAMGRLDEALMAFARVPPEQTRLFAYGVFQVGKIHRAREAFGEMAEHFESYANRRDLDPHPRLSEALYWLGWARMQEGQPAEALPVFEDALRRFGNDPDQHEIQAILGSLAEVQWRIDAAAGGGRDDRSFAAWIDREATEALARDQFTYYARLRAYLAESLRQRGRTDEATAILITLSDQFGPEVFGAEELGMVALAMAEAGLFQADAYLESLLDRFPQSVFRGHAYLGFARMAMREGDHAGGVIWAERFLSELPVHPRAHEVRLLLGEALLADNRPDRTIEVFEELLRLRDARGRPHAQALLGIARAEERAGRPARASAFYVRVFNMYRGFPEEADIAYRGAARILEELGDLRGAFRTWAEAESFAGDRLPGLRAVARENRRRLEPLLPPEPEPVEASAMEGA